MTLKPRKTKHSNRMGWASIKTRGGGWGLKTPLDKSLIHSRRFILALAGVSFIVLALTSSVSSSFTGSIRQDCNEVRNHQLAFKGMNVSCPNDPTTYLWQSVNNLSPVCTSFSFYLASCSSLTRNGHLANAIALSSNSTDSAVALSKSPVDLSVLSSKFLWALFAWALDPNLSGTNIIFGIYITTNKTLPQHQPSFDPRLDKGTQAIMLSAYNGSPNFFSMDLMIQRNPQNTIASDNNGCNVSSSSCWLQLTFNLDPKANWIEPSFGLNYTSRTSGVNGCNGIVGDGCSFMEEFQTTTHVTTQTIPNMPFVTGNSYVGFFALPNMGTNAFFTFDSSTIPSVCTFECSQMLLYVPAPTAVIAPPNLDTSGFFGPIIRALIQIGVFIAQNLISFFAYLGSLIVPVVAATLSQLANAIKLALNAIGSFFGWGNLGDSLFTFTNGVVTAVVQVLLAIGSYIADIVNRVITFLSIVSNISGQIFGANGFLAAFFALASNTITQLVGIFAKFVLLGTPAITVYDWLLYFQLTGDAGFEGFGAWWGFNRWLAFAFINLTILIINKAVTAITDLLSYIPTIAAHMPEDGLPALPTLQNIPFPGLRIPTGHVQKFREGDPAAVALWIFGAGLFISLLSLNVPGVNPLANIVAGSGCNPVSCFNTAYTQVFLPFTMVFVIIISGVFITEILHGVTMGNELPRIVVNVPRIKVSGTARGQPFRFGTKKFVTLQKGSAKKAARQKEQISPEQAYENRHGGRSFGEQA